MDIFAATNSSFGAVTSTSSPPFLPIFFSPNSFIDFFDLFIHQCHFGPFFDQKMDEINQTNQPTSFIMYFVLFWCGLYKKSHQNVPPPSLSFGCNLIHPKGTSIHPFFQFPMATFFSPFCPLNFLTLPLCNLNKKCIIFYPTNFSNKLFLGHKFKKYHKIVSFHFSKF